MSHVSAPVSAVTPRFDLPQLGLGLGLRSTHYRDLMAADPATSGIGWLEIISDNYSESDGRPLEHVERIAARYPLVMHGVSLNIGGPGKIDRAYVANLRRLRERVGARWVSDHLCWTGLPGRNTHDLLPLPLTRATLKRTVERVREVQELLGAPLLMENPSTYVAFAADEIPEAEFLAELAERADCGLLLDVNNVYVSHRNHGFDPQDYLAAIPWARVVQLHLAGHSDHGTHCVDTHDQPVCDAVWQLFSDVHQRCPHASVLLEWDGNIPPLADAVAELHKARAFMSAERA